MKIKTKKQLNLPQLIEWVEKNGIRNHVFISDIDRNEVEINIHGCIFCKYITLKDTFTVEVEEAVTEDTELNLFIETYETRSGDKHCCECFDTSIRKAKNNASSKSLAFYILNEDLTMTLIWRDGRLIE